VAVKISRLTLPRAIIRGLAAPTYSPLLNSRRIALLASISHPKDFGGAVGSVNFKYGNQICGKTLKRFRRNWGKPSALLNQRYGPLTAAKHAAKTCALMRGGIAGQNSIVPHPLRTRSRSWNKRDDGWECPEAIVFSFRLAS
jgi:hypothetical protein